MYHCSIKIISRSSGKSAVASSAYRSGEKLEDKETGITHDYTNKGGVIYNEVMLPEHAPEKYKDRATLWNEVEKIEKRTDAQLAREVEVALPKELTREKQIEVVQEYVKTNFVEKGMCADWALHDKGDGNPHAHIMLTTRPIKETGEWGEKQKSGYKLDEQGQKIPTIDPSTGLQKIGARNRKVWERETVPTTDWNDQSRAEEWRASWAKECNKHLSQDKQIDHRSYERQGKEQIPTIHEGYQARQMEKDGKVSELCQTNRDIKEYNNLNQELSRLGALRQALLQQLENIKKKAKEALNERLQRLRTTRTTNEPVGRDADRNRTVQADNPRTTDRSIKERLASLRNTRQNGTDDSTVGELIRSASADLSSTRAEERASEKERDNKISQRKDRDLSRERQRAEAQQRVEEAKRITEARKAESRASLEDLYPER